MKRTTFKLAIMLCGMFGAHGYWRNDIFKWTKLRNCEHYQTFSDYYQYFDLNSIAGAKPTGYRVKFPFSVVGEKNPHIILSEKRGATIWTQYMSDPAYEIMIGHQDGENTKSYLRRSGPGELKMELTPDVMSPSLPTDVLISVSDDGFMELEIDGKTLVNARDARPFQINYVGFRSWEGAVLQFFYNCSTAPRTNNPRTTYLVWENLLYCNLYHRTHYDPYQFFDLSTISGTKPSGYRVKFPFYVVGEKNPHILLSENEINWVWSQDMSELAYEIMIGDQNGANTLSYLRRSGGSGELNRELTPGVLSESVPTHFVLSVTNDGLMSLEANGQVIIMARDEHPFPINYVGFRSWEDIDLQFYFDCATATPPEQKPDTVYNYHINNFMASPTNSSSNVSSTTPIRRRRRRKFRQGKSTKVPEKDD